jgi:LppP/LprE lipoprotein
VHLQTLTLTTLAVVVSVSVSGVAAQTGSTWLDRAMSAWNEPAKGVPPAQPGKESMIDLARQCGSTALATSPTADAIRKAGWVPFLHFDQVIARNDIEVIGGMTAATTPGCEPMVFNLFVFVGGRFAGTVSPATMGRNLDGVAGAVRITGDNTLVADFARYTPADTECCPSSRVRVSYRIEGGGSRPVLVAVDTRRSR